MAENDEESSKGAQRESRLTCPHCGYAKDEIMPRDSCLFFYECAHCHVRLKPKAGDCCVFCSYGSVRCPPAQEAAGVCSERKEEDG